MSFATLDNDVLMLTGAWSVADISHADAQVKKILAQHNTIRCIDASRIQYLDTAGAYLIRKISKPNNIPIEGLNDHARALFELVSHELNTMESATVSVEQHDFFYCVGKKATQVTFQTIAAIGFLGELFVELIKSLLAPVKLQWRSIVYEIDVGGYRALPIIAVMMALIGVVVAYQLGVQLKIYGANVYIVDLSGVAILREFSPLICSVIVAGRTSTAFAALIGTMKVNEEIDALQTMGLSPMDRLVLPKIIGLIVALPLLVVWGDIFGIIGSMVMAKSMAGISFTAFLERFQQEVALKHLYLGLVKTPVFAVIVAGIGCFQGFQAEGSAQSVGERTTKAAVQAIFLIILADGLFSILFNWMDV